MTEAAVQEDVLNKAIITGNGVVQPGDSGGRALRPQFLLDYLEQVSFEQDDARLMKLIDIQKVPTTTVEWNDFLSYGGPGDDFVGESGVSGNFDVFGADDNYNRQIQNVKFMGTKREIGIIANMVNNTNNPTTLAQKGGTLELISKMNLASYFADSTTNVLQFNGFEAQCRQFLAQSPGDQDILFDAQGQPLSKDLVLDAAKTCRKHFGKPSMLITSVDTNADAQKLLFPEARTGEGRRGGDAGGYFDKFPTRYGIIGLEEDVMLRANRPLVADGVGLDGKPRSTATSDAGALSFTSTPFVVAPVAVSPGNAPFHQFATNNGTLQGYPANPGKPSLPVQGGRVSNQTAPGSYFYAVAPVYYGREGAAWVYGEAAPGIFTGAASVTTTAATPVAALALAITSITGLGSTYASQIVKFRVYRAYGTTASYLSDFDYMGDVGITPTGAVMYYDNGYTIPGSDTAFLFTESKNGSKGIFMAQLLPLLKRPLPNTELSDRFALLAFVTPIVKVPRHHIIIRNIGKLS